MASAANPPFDKARPVSTILKIARRLPLAMLPLQPMAGAQAQGITDILDMPRGHVAIGLDGKFCAFDRKGNAMHYFSQADLRQSRHGLPFPDADDPLRVFETMLKVADRMPRPLPLMASASLILQLTRVEYACGLAGGVRL